MLTPCQNNREKYPERPQLRLLEFDDRFSVFKDDFVPYDFKQPFKLDGMIFALENSPHQTS